MTGLLFDRTGSYQVPFLVITGCVLLAFAAAAGLRVREPASRWCI